MLLYRGAAAAAVVVGKRITCGVALEIPRQRQHYSTAAYRLLAGRKLEKHMITVINNA